jgi:hypothetical protein
MRSEQSEKFLANSHAVMGIMETLHALREPRDKRPNDIWGRVFAEIIEKNHLVDQVQNGEDRREQKLFAVPDADHSGDGLASTSPAAHQSIASQK